MSSADAIRTQALTKSYGKVLAVDRLELQVERGEIYGFLGRNGAGKTTTIRMLLAMVRPSGGAVHLFGTRVTPGSAALWRSVGHLVETAVAYPELSVRENLEIVRRLHGVLDPRTTSNVIEQLGLAAYADRRARTLSLGNLQRLGLAKALLHEPQLLLLDEPANGLDPAGLVEVRELLRELARERGTTVFMSSHMLAEVERLATRIGIIHKGRLVEELDAGDLEHRRRRRLVIGAREPSAARAALAASGFRVAATAEGLELDDPRAVEHPERIACLLVEAGAPPTLLAVRQEDLEARFLRLTDASAPEREAED